MNTKQLLQSAIVRFIVRGIKGGKFDAIAVDTHCNAPGWGARSPDHFGCNHSIMDRPEN